MTICIAALCDQGKSAVVAADRMGVFGGGSLLEFKLDDQVTKIHKVTDQVVLLHSGNLQDGELICEKVKYNENFENLGDAIDLTVMELIEKRRNLEVSRRLGNNFDYEKLVTVVGNVSSGPLYDLLQQVRRIDLGDMLIVAWNSAGRYEIHCHRPPAFPLRSDLHYATVGSGGIYARAALTIQQYTSSAKVSETLFQVYSAKKAAELVYGVGEPTDMAVLTEKGILDVSSETLTHLEELRQEKSKYILSEEQSLKLRGSIGIG